MTIEMLKRRKQELGYSYETISALSGVPLSTVQKIFGGLVGSPRCETLKKLESALFGSYEMRLSEISDHTVLRDPAAETFALDLDPMQGRHTFEDWLLLPANSDLELMDGEYFYVGSPSIRHQLISGDIYSAFKNFIREHQGGCKVFMPRIGVRLCSDKDDAVEPDVFVVCQKEKMLPSYISGAPDLTVEVRSKNDTNRYILKKFNKYRDAGVREYWLVDPAENTIETYLFTEEGTLVNDYTFDDRVPVRIWDKQCVVDFAEIKEDLKSVFGNEPLTDV